MPKPEDEEQRHEEEEEDEEVEWIFDYTYFLVSMSFVNFIPFYLCVLLSFFSVDELC